MVSLVSSMHRLKQTQSFKKEHLTNSTTFKERNEALTISSTCESRMKVDPDLKVLGVIEKTSSKPPVLGEPSPTLILILHLLNSTFHGSNWCSYQSRYALAVEYGPTLMTFRWLGQAPGRSACQSPTGKKSLYRSRGHDSMRENRSRLGKMRPALRVSGS
jgi:hypothetical protein